MPITNQHINKKLKLKQRYPRCLYLLWLYLHQTTSWFDCQQLHLHGSRFFVATSNTILYITLSYTSFEAYNFVKEFEKTENSK